MRATRSTGQLQSYDPAATAFPVIWWYDSVALSCVAVHTHVLTHLGHAKLTALLAQNEGAYAREFEYVMLVMMMMMMMSVLLLTRL